MGGKSEVPGSTGGQHWLGRFVDHGETYGSHVIQDMIRNVKAPTSIVDIGAGSGRDLAFAKAIHPQIKTIAVEAGREYAANLAGMVDEVHVLNIERDKLPFADNSVSIIMANQVLEHTKEIFWIFHEVSRVLAHGGHFIFGVPNVLSFHNRIMGLTGAHPTQHKLYSAHVRPFSKRDTLKFLDVCSPGTYTLAGFGGSQFYPFPKPVARFISGLAPTLAFSIFFSIQKTGNYNDDFIKFPAKAELETNFYTGSALTSGQY